MMSHEKGCRILAGQSQTSLHSRTWQLLAFLLLITLLVTDEISALPTMKKRSAAEGESSSLSANDNIESDLFEKAISADNEDLRNTESVDGLEMAWRVERYPNPQTSPNKCRRPKPSFVCDPDSVLTRDEADSLDREIMILQNATSCVCEEEVCRKNKDKGITIGIAIMKNMFTPYQVPLGDITKNNAMQLRESWNLGKCGDDILILLAVNNQQSYSAVGPGTQRILTQETANKIFLDNEGHFNESRFYSGLDSMISSYYQNFIIFPKTFYMSPSNMQSESDEDESKLGAIIGVVVALAVVVAIAAFIGVTVRRRMNGEHEKFRFGTRPATKKDNLRPISVNPISSPGGVYEPCSTEDSGMSFQSPSRPEERYDLEENREQPSDEDSEDNDTKRARGLSAVTEEDENENQESSDFELAQSKSRTTTETEDEVEIHDPNSIRKISMDENDTTRV